VLRTNIIVSSLILLIATTAHAERWVCYDGATFSITKRVEGDCLRLGICSGYNNTGIQANCVEATSVEWDKSAQQYVKFDTSVVSGSRVVDLTQAEIDAILAAQAQAAAAAEAIKVASLDTALSNAKVADYTLTKIDTAIDGIANLADAKVFLKRLVRAIVAMEKNR